MKNKQDKILDISLGTVLIIIGIALFWLPPTTKIYSPIITLIFGTYAIHKGYQGETKE